MSAGQITQGRRVYCNEIGLKLEKPGDYGTVNGHWKAWPPGILKRAGGAYLDSHTVTEHEDGTITVSPSILWDESMGTGDTWHGYLERGVWREA